MLWLLSIALADPTACLPCHAETHARWSTSRHAEAATNPVFTASWEHWPNGWCLQCHAPSEASQRARLGRVAVPGVLHPLPDDPPGEAWAWGVDCETCHGSLDAPIRTASEPAEAATAVHDLVVDPDLTNGTLCARCHEFPFQKHTPRWPFAYGETPAQATVSEWRTSTAAAEGTGCADCHMGEAGHGFPGAHDRELVRSALTFAASRDGDSVTLAVAAPNAPHRIPTGDPFRRIELALCTDDTCDEVVARHRLRRVFEADATSWSLAEDRTLPPQTDPHTVPTRRFTAEAPAARWWRATYHFGDPQFEADLPDDEVGFVIAEGDVPR